MSKAAELAALIANVNKGSSLANKNLVINGAMNVAQRGTSFSFAHDGTTSAFTLDRFKFIVSNTDEFDGTLTQATDVPSGEGFVNSLKWTTGTAESALASNEVMYIEHMVEAQNVAGLRYGTADAKPVTLSFWVKSSITGTFNSGIFQSDGSRIITKTYTISSANTWEYKTLTFAGDTSGTINDDNGEGLRPIWNIFSGSDYTSSDSTSWGSYSSATWAYGHAQNAHATTAGATFLLTGVQLEIGEKATEFEYEPYEATLEKCHRYYEAHTLNSYTNIGFSYSTTQFIIPYHWKVEKRASPTFSFPTVGTSSGNLGVTVATGNYPSTHGSVLRGSAQPTQGYIYNNAGDGYAGLTDDHICILYGFNSPILALDAEL